MAQLRATFWIYITAWVVVVHLVLLPALYFGMGYVIRESHEDLFIEHARTFSRVLADEFEVGVALDSQTRTEDLLDFAISHGGAPMRSSTRRAAASAALYGSSEIKTPRSTDLSFGQGCHLAFTPSYGQPTRRAITPNCACSFDEQPTQERIQLALTRMIWLLAGYLVVAITIAIILRDCLSAPNRSLAGRVSRHLLGR